MMKRYLTCLSLLAVAALAGCSSDSGGPAPDPLAAYKSQVVDWQTCDPGILGFNSTEGFARIQASLGDRLKCAMITVPLDYENPARGDLKIAVMRTRAARQEERLGSIFFNPGGPGADGLDYAARYGQLWNLVNPQDEIGAALAKLGNRYDLIGFSPRGTGASTQLVCGSNEYQYEVSSYDRHEEVVRAQLYNAGLTARTCLKNPLTPYINTEQTVRDMDLIRHLLGDEKLNFIGYSYGTWLGSWYASRFPERTGRMLLDSNMNVAGTFDDANLMRALGQQRLMDDYMAPYAARNHTTFNLGTTVDAVRRVFPALSTPWLKNYMQNLLHWTGYAEDINDNLYRLRAAQVLDTILQNHPATPPDTIRELIAVTPLVSDPEKNQELVSFAQELYKNIAPDIPRYPVFKQRQSILLKSDDTFFNTAVFNAVACNDIPTNLSLDFWILMGNQQLADYPVYGGSATMQPCLYWGGPTVQKPPISATNRVVGGILMLQSRFDALTPFEGAMNGFAQITNARMVVVEQEYRHGLFPYGTPCVDLTIANYFLNGDLPPERVSFCDGTEDVRAIVQPQTAAATASKASLNLKDSLRRTYRDPEQAARIINDIKAQIR